MSDQPTLFDNLPQDVEIWLDVVGYEGYYKVSNIGRVKSLDRKVRQGDRWMTIRERILKPCLTYGYHAAALYKEGSGRTRYVHTLVLEAFAGPCPQGMECRHFPDPCRTNNHLCNIQWGTRVEQKADQKIHGTLSGAPSLGEDHWKAKLTDDEVLWIRAIWPTWTQSRKALADILGVNSCTIRDIVQNITWRHLLPCEEIPYEE